MNAGVSSSAQRFKRSRKDSERDWHVLTVLKTSKVEKGVSEFNRERGEGPYLLTTATG